MYRWSIQGPSASFTSSLGILAVVGMGAHLLRTDPEFTTGQFFAFFTLRKYVLRTCPTVGFN